MNSQPDSLSPAADNFAPQQAPSRGHLLLVEDHDVNQILLKAMIERLGYDSELAIDGADAVAKIDRAVSTDRPIDLVLMDLNMPVMNGCEATRMIRASGLSANHLPIIAVTANADRDDVERCLAAGMQDHVAKPVLLEELRRVLDKSLHRSAPQEGPDMSFQPVPHLSEDLNDRYAARRDQALCSLASLVRTGTFLEQELQEVADHMHKLAGTAAMFGEAELGLAAKKLEDGIANWQISERPDKLKESMASILELARSGGQH